MSDDLARTIEAAVQAQVAGAQVDVLLEGNRVLIEVTSTLFDGMSRVDRQRTVYACIEDMISDGRLHAVTIRANPPA
jgi:acid stress-induced BolA-like protein IbaG/YrbA